MKYLVTEGDLTIKGRDASGNDIEVTADIENLKVEVEAEYGDIIYNTNSFIYSPLRRNTSFHMKVKDTYHVRILPPSGVVRTARVLGWEDPEAAEARQPTIALIREAATRAGVDEITDFELIYERDTLRGMNKVYVEFRWEA